MKQDEMGRSLLEAFAQIPDRRSVHGRRHPLPAILALATAAMLAGARSLYAIAQWGRLQSPEVVRALGFTRARTPAVATLHYTFKALDVDAFEAALRGWAQQIGAGAEGARAERYGGPPAVGGAFRGAGWQRAPWHPWAARRRTARRTPGGTLRCAGRPRAGASGGSRPVRRRRKANRRRN